MSLPLRGARRLLAAVALLLLPAAVALAAPRDQEIRTLVSKGSADRANWAVYAVNLDTGAALADVNGGKLMIPASTRKLVSTALAARYIGGDKRIETLAHVGAVPSGGTVSGDLVVRAMGDPSWNPDLLGGRPGGSVLRDLAKKIASAGVTRVDGDLVIDASRFDVPAPLPDGWEWQDMQTVDGAIPAVFGIDKNLCGVRIEPAGTGQPPTADVPAGAFDLVNNAVTGSRGSAPTFTLFRSLDGSRVELMGSLPADSGAATRSIPLGHPAEYAAEQMLRILGESGVAVSGKVRISLDSVPARNAVGIVSSPTIAEMMAAANKPSDNYIAESLYLLAGAHVFSRGSYRASHELESRYWKSIKVEGADVEGVDGSGLSRRNFVTPKAMVALLADMKDDQAFLESLPVAGVDGTMRYRLAEQGLSKRVRAKTGTLTGVVGLAGYATTNNGSTVAFAVYANNFTASAPTIRAVVDDVVGVLAR